jgi:glycine betaine/proline transport system substrate-binding protein
MLKKGKKLMALATLLMMTLFAVGCGGGATDTNGDDPGTASKGTVRLLFVEWACARAETYVMADILEPNGHRNSYKVAEDFHPKK